MYKIGQKVEVIDALEPAIGYIVKIEIDPLEETEVVLEVKNWVFYTVRVYKDFYTDGYTEYYRTEREIRNADD